MKRTPKKTTEPASEDALLLRRLVAAFTRNADDIQIDEEAQGPSRKMLRMWVHAADQSRVVGAGGRHIHALRTIFQYVGARAGTAVKITLEEPRTGDKDGAALPAAPREFDAEAVTGLLRDVLGRVLVKPFELEAFDAGEDSTTVEVHVHDDERQIMKRGDDAGLLLSVQPIFNAIGKVGGRQLFVTLPEAMPEALKP
jgi:predicted RNA-binding protein YlqC (UPF0109 family)